MCDHTLYKSGSNRRFQFKFNVNKTKNFPTTETMTMTDRQDTEHEISIPIAPIRTKTNVRGLVTERYLDYAITLQSRGGWRAYCSAKRITSGLPLLHSTAEDIWLNKPFRGLKSRFGVFYSVRLQPLLDSKYSSQAITNCGRLKGRENYDDWCFAAENVLVLEGMADNIKQPLPSTATEAQIADDLKAKAKLILTIDASLYIEENRKPEISPEGVPESDSDEENQHDETYVPEDSSSESEDTFVDTMTLSPEAKNIISENGDTNLPEKREENSCPLTAGNGHLGKPQQRLGRLIVRVRNELTQKKKEEEKKIFTNFLMSPHKPRLLQN
ncbi:hypothetical protein HW555_003593 [Spodoptera exigua]|uniref:Uncharacterized protein n=1 Tax=Spodoptera exigua TaxID=7107 RepID=A0A835GN01_SPOEX|nr:hypothetical protein HW555_003593 [Spodoptera exigua]